MLSIEQPAKQKQDTEIKYYYGEAANYLTQCGWVIIMELHPDNFKINKGYT